MRTPAPVIVLAALMWGRVVCAQQTVPSGDPAYQPLTKAFEALNLHDFDQAILSFRRAAILSPHRSDVRKNLAYALLKTGDSDSARNEFGEAMRIDPTDFHVALEYAFLCYEDRTDAAARKAEARRIFAAVSAAGDAESRATASNAFRNIDESLRAGIERWQRALAKSAPAFSAHYELAQLAEQRDELDLAASNYRAAFLLSPQRKSVLLELARVEKARGSSEGMMAALIAASRGPEPRTAELAREQLPSRYPYVYEFRQALELDSANEPLRRELAYLLLKMSENGQAAREDAEKEFSALIAMRDDPGPPDYYVSVAQLGLLYLGDQRTDKAMPFLNRVLARGDKGIANRVRMALQMPLVLAENSTAISMPDQRPLDSRVLGDRSYQAGFLKDALRYFTQAREDNPLDSSIALKLGWTNNLLHDDTTALRWFSVARQSADSGIAAEAKRAWLNLKPDTRRIRTTVWLYPLFSSRWNDLFGYGQAKTELRIKSLPFHPYVSVRMAGDVRRRTSGFLRQNLSESAFIAAAGVSTDAWHRAVAWFEAGVATSYLNGTHWSDYRGGVSYTRTRGASLTSEHPGWFLETAADSVYVSHFGKDVVNYVQTRFGYSTPLRGIRTQTFWNQNFTFDLKGQYWANFTEMGPGFRVHPPGLPPSVWINVSAVRGVYLRNDGNPRRPNFYDIHIGVWYAFTK